MSVKWDVKAKALGAKRRKANSTWLATYADQYLQHCRACLEKNVAHGYEYPFLEDEPRLTRLCQVCHGKPEYALAYSLVHYSLSMADVAGHGRYHSGVVCYRQEDLERISAAKTERKKAERELSMAALTETERAGCLRGDRKGAKLKVSDLLRPGAQGPRYQGHNDNARLPRHPRAQSGARWCRAAGPRLTRRTGEAGAQGHGSFEVTVWDGKRATMDDGVAR